MLGGRPPTYDDLSRLPYTEQVFADRSPEVDTFSATWSVPVTLGVAFTF